MTGPSFTKILLITTTVLLGLIIRLYRLDQPIADWHSHRQADTASVTKNFIARGINLFYPTYHDLSNVQSGLDNPRGYRFVEFPVYNLICVLAYKITLPLGVSLDLTSRLVSITLSLLSSFLVFIFTWQVTRQFTPSWLSQAVFLFLPYNIYYSRAILPEPTAVFFMMLSLVLFWNHLWSSSLALALALLIKPAPFILIFPFLILFSKKHPPLSSLVFIIIAISPLLWWRFWMKQFPQGIPANNWLLNTQGKPFVDEWFHGYNLSWLNRLVAFRPHWFHWLFFDRIANLILGSYGLIPLFLGLLYPRPHSQRINFAFFVGILLYFIIFAQGNIQHDYYQILLVPLISITLGLGYYYLLRFTFKKYFLSIPFTLIIFTFSAYFSWERIKTYYRINNPNIISAGQAADQLLPQNALVIAPYVGDTAFLYQTKRSGWPTEIYNFDIIKKEHPQNPIYLVSVNFDTYTNSLIKLYPVVAQNNRYVILNLSQPPPP